MRASLVTSTSPASSKGQPCSRHKYTLPDQPHKAEGALLAERAQEDREAQKVGHRGAGGEQMTESGWALETKGQSDVALGDREVERKTHSQSAGESPGPATPAPEL